VTAATRAVDWARLAAAAAADKLATDIVGIDVSETVGITDIFLICSASNDRQVRSIVDAVEAKLDEIDVDPLRREGEQEGRWILLDYGDIVVHVQHAEEREFYQLPRLWRDCPTIDLQLPVPSSEAPSSSPA
jgi:ribosome-associated protein